MNKNKASILIFLLISFAVGLAGWFDLFNVIQAYHLTNSVKWLVSLVIVGFLTVLPLCLFILYGLPGTSAWISSIFEKLKQIKAPIVLQGILIIILVSSYAVMIISFYGQFLEGFYLRLFIVWFLSTLSALIIGPKSKNDFLVRFVIGLMLVTFFYVIISFRKSISASTFTMAWSEGSRYYYASLFNSSKLYGERLAWSFLHPSRYLLLSIPFFVGDFPIIVHRIWQSFLWVAMPFFSIWIFKKRVIKVTGYRFLMFALWSFLFLFQGPVYYHLFVCVWLVLLGYDREKPWKTTLFVLLGSIWAGISRVNWFPVPAMIAIILYLVDTPYHEAKAFWKYYIQPLLFTALGLTGAVGSQLLYVVLSGQKELNSFGSSFTSDLLWYRLWPNATGRWGIVLPIIILSLPAILLIVKNIRRRKLHFWQWFPILAISGILFLGGMVVSVKIGGGANLHNMDAWLVILWVLIGKLAFDESIEHSTVKANWKPAWLLIVLFALPSFYQIDLHKPYVNLAPFKIDSIAESEEKGAVLQQARQYAAMDEEVLFISQRQLWMFEGKDIPLVDEYELLTLMEMAISNNTPYLEQFASDLQAHRFAMIVIEKQEGNIEDADSNYYAEENNAWVRNISIPLLENYEQVHDYPYSHITILEPKP